MTRIFRNLAAFFFGWLLVAVPMLAFAETIPATQGYTYTAPLWKYSVDGWTGATCEAVAAYKTSISSYTVTCGPVTGAPPYQESYLCRTSNGNCTNYGYAFQSCPAGYSQVAGEGCKSQTQSLTCPATGGWTLNGSTCTRPDCAAGQTRGENGQCYGQCPASGTSGTATGTWVEGTGALPSSLCVGGCGYGASACVGFGGIEYACQVGKSNGLACSTSTTGSNGVPTENSPSQSAVNNQNAINCIQAGQGYGTVNGVTVCSGPASSSTSSSTTTTTSTDPSNNTTNTTTSTSTSCSGGDCTTTTTTTGPGGPSSVVTTQPQGEFCKTNKDDPVCKGQTPTEQEDYCSKNPEAVACLKTGTPSDGDPLQTKTLGVSVITPIDVATNMGCPPPIQLPHNWGQIDYAPVCNLADLIRPFVLIFAWLGAGLIVVGGIKSDG